MDNMTIRSEYQPTVDEFIDDLTQFATGSYLGEDEKEFWEAPYDATALPELKSILERLLDALDVLPADPPAEALTAVVSTSYKELTEFNRRHENAVIEPEEREEIAKLVYEASASTGADDEALGELPDFDY